MYIHFSHPYYVYIQLRILNFKFCYESCLWCRIDHSTCWPAVHRATTSLPVALTNRKIKIWISDKHRWNLLKVSKNLHWPHKNSHKQKQNNQTNRKTRNEITPPPQTTTTTSRKEERNTKQEINGKSKQSAKKCHTVKCRTIVSVCSKPLFIQYYDLCVRPLTSYL